MRDVVKKQSNGWHGAYHFAQACSYSSSLLDVSQRLRFFNVDSKAVDRASLANLRRGNFRFPVHQRRRRPSNPCSQIRRSRRIPHYPKQELERGNRGPPVLRMLSLCTCCRHYPGAAAGRTTSLIPPTVSAFPERVVGSACASSSVISGLPLTADGWTLDLGELRRTCQGCFTVQRVDSPFVRGPTTVLRADSLLLFNIFKVFHCSTFVTRCSTEQLGQARAAHF
jgi:hypothetical protein